LPTRRRWHIVKARVVIRRELRVELKTIWLARKDLERSASGCSKTSGGIQFMESGCNVKGVPSQFPIGGRVEI
jgi:hypothetical protein